MPDKKFFIIGIDASQKSFDALLTFFKNLSFCKESAIILKHSLPNKETKILKETITSSCPKTLVCADSQMHIKPNHIYILKKKHSILLDKHNKTITQTDEDLSIEKSCFLSDLAQNFGNRSIGIIFSETPDIETSGLAEIKKRGGMTLLQKQSPKELKKLRVDKNIQDAVSFHLSPSVMPKFIKVHIKNPFMEREALSPKDENIKMLIAEIFQIIKEKTNLDFSGYKLNTICRRLDRRMNLTKTKDLTHYIKKLTKDPKEVYILQQSFLINVTNFFRDKQTFNLLQKDFIPRLFSNMENNCLRLWCAACSSGEEAYSLAIILKEFTEKNNLSADIKIIGSDISASMIQTAKDGIYPETIGENISLEILEKYFTKINRKYQVKTSIRKIVSFREENVLDPSDYTDLDMVSCRNFMIYLNNQKQEKVISIFRKTLKPKGLLLLGSAETLKKQNALFKTVDYKHKIFQKI